MSEQNDGGARPDTTANPPFRVGLSGKLLLLTILFVMLAEVLIYIPSIANVRTMWLKDRAATARLAVLALDATPDNMVPQELAKRLLDEPQKTEDVTPPPHITPCGMRVPGGKATRSRRSGRQPSGSFSGSGRTRRRFIRHLFALALA